LVAIGAGGGGGGAGGFGVGILGELKHIVEPVLLLPLIGSFEELDDRTLARVVPNDTIRPVQTRTAWGKPGIQVVQQVLGNRGKSVPKFRKVVHQETLRLSSRAWLMRSPNRGLMRARRSLHIALK
jgi:hypothetical protein